jgi:YidC/Oxa1 family membrane protein insertase
MWDAIIITPFINILLFIYTLTGGNFGVAIILFTLFVRLMTHPLMVSQIKSSASMQDFQKTPRWIEAQEKYKNDREKLAQEQMAIYKELGISPFSSCLPMLIQFPIIIGLYQAVIQSMVISPLDLLRLVRHVYPWAESILPGMNVNAMIPLNDQFLWMNLGQPEKLLIPGLPFGIPVLAILVVITTYLQSRLITPPAMGTSDPSILMTGMMNLYMPIFMGWMAWTQASGLSLYFLVSNVAGILQYTLLGQAKWSNILPRQKGLGPVVISPGNLKRGITKKQSLRSSKHQES